MLENHAATIADVPLARHEANGARASRQVTVGRTGS